MKYPSLSTIELIKMHCAKQKSLYIIGVFTLFLLLILFVPEPGTLVGHILFRLTEAILLITLVTLIIGYRFETYRKLLWEAEREKILRQITDRITETSDIVEIENIIVTEIGRLFNANRCLIRDYIPEHNTFSEPTAEYLSDESVKSLKNFCIIKETNKLLTEYLVQKKLIVSDDIERHLAVNGWQNSALANFIREFSIKAGILQIIMTYKDEILGLLAVHYTKNKLTISQDDIEFIKNIIQEASSVIYQIKLYEREAHALGREQLLREIIGVVQRAFEIEKIMNLTVNKIGETFNAYRCFIMEIDENTGKYKPIKHEYRSPSAKSLIGIYPDIVVPELAKLMERGEGVISEEMEDFFHKLNLSNSKSAEFLRDYNVRSRFAIPIYYGSNFLGTLIGHFNQPYAFTNSDVEFVKTFTGQLAIAIYQAKQYENLRRTLEREKLLREVSQVIAGTMDIDLIKSRFVELVGEYFKADRCGLVKYDMAEQKFVSVSYEYLSPEEDISLLGFNPDEGIPEIIKTVVEEQEHIAPDIVEFLKRNNLMDSVSAKAVIEHKVKSSYAFPVFYLDKIYGFVFLHYTQKIKFLSNDEINFIRALANRLGISVYQAELFETKRNYAELFDTASTAIMLLDENGFWACNQMTLEVFGCSTKEEFLRKQPAEISPDMQPDGADSVTAANEKIKTAMEKGYNRFDWMHKRLDNGEEFPAEVILKTIEVKGKKVIQATVWDITERKKLIDTIKQTAERERLLRDITDTIRSTLDIDEVLKIICIKVAEVFNVQRITISQHPKDIIRHEYKAYPDIKGLADAPMDKRIVSFWGEALESGLEYVVLDNIEEANIPDFVKEFYKSIDTKSIIGIPIQSEQEKWGGFVLAQTDNYRHWTHNEIDLLKSISGQIYIAIKQAELSEREKLLKTISETIRSTLNIREVKKHAVREIAKTFQADRCFISEYTEENDKFAPIDSYSEYLLSPDTSSLEGYDWSTVLEIGMMLKEGKEIIFSKVDEVYELFKGNQTLINNTRKIFEDYNIKAGLVIPIFHLDKFLGILGFNYKTEKDLSEEEINLARALANQIGVALFQAKLYEKETQIARREALINKVVGIIAEEPDIKVARNIILKEICTMLNADRCDFRVFNQNKQEFPAPEAEYVRTPEIKSLIDEPIKQEGLKFFFENAEKQKDYLPLIVNQKFLDEKNMRNTPLDEYFKECGIKTDIAIPMRDKENELSFLVLHYKEDVPNITEEEAAFLETLAKQIIIAVDRAKLLENTKKIARREKILRELVEEVRLSQSTIDIYNYIIAKTADIFDADRVCVSEKSEYSYLPAKIDYEFIRTEGMQSLSDIELPKGFLNIFTQVKDTLSLVDIDNLAEYMPEDAKLQQFFREYNLASMLVMPFIRYNSETKILGIIILFSSTPHKWTQDDKETLKAIAESTVRIIWEITKIREINEIRDIFTMTLAHDLQIPLIAEKKALEFLRSRPPDKPIGEFMEFLDIMARDNQSIVSLLNRLLYIYSYERGKRKLTLSVIPVLELIEETLDKLKKLIEEKSITISYEIDRESFKVLADREEIKRVICIILENAITYSHPNSIIRINCFMSDDKVITVIRDEGTGIPEYIRHKLFQRYQMVEIIERKIGSGLGLYLAKLIIEAHGGNIWYETVLNKGSAFYFSLPAAKEGK